LKSAALIFGVIAGLLGVAVFMLGNIDSSLAAVAALGPDRETLARLIAYLVPAVCWLGAGLALGHPRLGGLVLLLSAAAWAAIAAIAGHGAIFFAAAPFIFAAAGGLVALFARRPAKRLPTTNVGADVDDVIAEARSAALPGRPAPIPPRTGPTRVDSRFPPTRRDDVGFEALPATRILPPFQDIVPDQEPASGPDLIEAKSAKQGPMQSVDDAEPSTAPIEPEESPTDPSTEAPITTSGPANSEVIVAAAPHPRRASEWTLPTPAAAVSPASPRYAAERQPAGPSRIEPLAPAVPPTPDQRPRGVSALDFGATNDFSARRGGASGRDDVDVSNAPGERDHFGRRWDADDAPAFKPDIPDEKSRGGGVRRVVRLLIALLFILVLLGVAAAVYLDYRRGPQSILFGRHPHLVSTNGATAATTSPPSSTGPASSHPAVPAVPAPLVPAPHPASKPTAIHSPVPAAPVSPPPPIVASTPTPAVAVSTAPTQPTPAALPAPGAAVAPSPAAVVTPSAPAPTPPATTADNTASPTSFTDPNVYCAAVGTVAAPDARYTGPPVPRAVTAALLSPESTPADQIHWRCADGAAFACSAHHTDACMPTPTVDDMLKYCAQHADAKNLPAPNGSWSCNGTRPVIPEDQSWPVDPQGFFPGAWIRVTPVG
jgi:hypothetical protein